MQIMEEEGPWQVNGKSAISQVNSPCLGDPLFSLWKNSGVREFYAGSVSFTSSDSRPYPGGNYLCSTSGENDSCCYGGESDTRFIPSRKDSKYSVMLTSAHDVKQSKTTKGQFVQNENDCSIASLYKRHVLELNGLEEKKLRFSKNNCSHNQNNRGGNNLNLMTHHKKVANEICRPGDLRGNGSGNGIEKLVKNLRSTAALGGGLVGQLNGDQSESVLAKSSEGCRGSNSSGKKLISYTQYKVLDAPGLIDDFYLNLLDWSTKNLIAVGLASQVYVWNGKNNSVQKVCDMTDQIQQSQQQQIPDEPNKVQAVQWSPSGNFLGIGDCRGIVQVFDATTLKAIQQLTLHSDRIGSLAWRDDFTLASGSRDKSIHVTDIRANNNIPARTIHRYTGHKQEVCGLKWSFDGQSLASGGNDNKLFVWSLRSSTHVSKFGEHKAGVKALAWSPHQHGLLVSGGGTADRTIRFWNTSLSKQIDMIESNSQVCNLVFSKNENEFVSTHGFQDNDIIVWKYPSLQKSARLTGHSCRVLQLGLSPCSTKIVTGAGDETLRFWDVFAPTANSPSNQNSSLLDNKFDLR